MALVDATNFTLSGLTVIGQVIAAILLVSFAAGSKFSNSLTQFINKNALVFAFVVALIATGGSLFYSEIIGFEPCKLCWFQRIFMYPQIILLGLAIWRKDQKIAIYNIALSAIGAIIAGYHYLLQIGVAPELKCSAVGYSVDCSQRFVLQFGYITIPMMAFTAFLLIILFLAGKKDFYAQNSDESLN